MTQAIRFGDLVFCSQEGSPAQAGVVAEVRRADARVQYLDAGRTVWAPLASLRRAASSETEGTLEGLVAEILSLLGGLELEFSRPPGGGRCRLIVSHGAIAPEALDRLRDRLGPHLLACLVRPQGMHRIQTLVDLAPGAERAARGSHLDPPGATG